jgi:hypothetical protein
MFGLERWATFGSGMKQFTEKSSLQLQLPQHHIASCSALPDFRRELRNTHSNRSVAIGKSARAS